MLHEPSEWESKVHNLADTADDSRATLSTAHRELTGATAGFLGATAAAHNHLSASIVDSDNRITNAIAGTADAVAAANNAYIGTDNSNTHHFPVPATPTPGAPTGHRLNL